MIRRPVDDVWLTPRAVALCRDLLGRAGAALAERGIGVDAIGDEEVIALPDGRLDIVVEVAGRDVFVARLPPEDWAWMAGKEP